MLLRNVTPCSQAERYCLIQAWCLHLLSWWRQKVSRTLIPLYQTTWHDIPKSVVFMRMSTVTRCGISPPSHSSSPVDCLFKVCVLSDFKCVQLGDQNSVYGPTVPSSAIWLMHAIFCSQYWQRRRCVCTWSCGSHCDWSWEEDDLAECNSM